MGRGALCPRHGDVAGSCGAGGPSCGRGSPRHPHPAEGDAVPRPARRGACPLFKRDRQRARPKRTVVLAVRVTTAGRHSKPGRPGSRRRVRFPLPAPLPMWTRCAQPKQALSGSSRFRPHSAPTGRGRAGSSSIRVRLAGRRSCQGRQRCAARRSVGPCAAQVPVLPWMGGGTWAKN